MNKKLIAQLGILFLLFPPISWGQENQYNERWEELQKQIIYPKSSQPKGPNNNRIYPENFDSYERDKDYFGSDDADNESIIYSREKRFNKGADKGIKKEMAGEIKPIEKEMEIPEMSQTKLKINPFSKHTKLISIIMYVVVIGLASFLIYFFFIKGKKWNQKVKVEMMEENPDPEIQNKSQLEKKLEKAIADNDYQLAIRIYYWILLKELIDKKWIVWQKRKTNGDYLSAIKRHSENSLFGEVIQIYEWTWYGKNALSADIFRHFESKYKQLLKQLENER